MQENRPVLARNAVGQTLPPLVRDPLRPRGSRLEVVAQAAPPIVFGLAAVGLGVAATLWR